MKKLICFTTKRYPSRGVDNIFVMEAAKSFDRALGENFLLVIAGGGRAEELKDINKIDLGIKTQRGRIIFCFFWIPYFFLWKETGNEETAVISNDFYLLSILVFWKKVFHWKYKICSEWHMLTEGWRDRWVAKNSDYLVATSERLAGLIVGKTGVDRDKILVARGGVDLNKFQNPNDKYQKEKLRGGLNLPVGVKLVGYMGGFKTMGMEKGLDTMIKALQFLPEEVIIIFVGGKEGEIEEYKSFAEREGVSKRCLFFPWQNEGKLAEFEQTMDVLVIPYPDRPHFRNYGFPMKVYEYMASGVPIVYSDLEIIKEVLGDCAVSFKQGDEKNLAEKIKELFQDKEKATDLSGKALLKVRNFTWGKRAEKIIDFLERK